jgi:hypothetical protein
MINDPQNPNDYELICMLARDASLLISETINPSYSTPHTPYFFISDDSTDYLDTAQTILDLAIPAICDDEHQTACTALANAIRTCDATFFEGDYFPCFHFLAIDFDSPILHQMPDYENCPNDA